MEAQLGILVGATGGIGRACARTLAALEPRLLAVGRASEKLKEFRPDIATCEADIASGNGRADVVTTASRIGIPIRYLVVASGVPHRSDIVDFTESDWDDTLRANLIGPALLLSELLALPWTRPAAVVFIGSLSGRRALPRRALYGASKAGLEHFAQVSAVELAPRGIAVNVVSAGIVETPFLGGDLATIAEFTRRRVPLGRMAQPEEVADLVRYLVAAPEYLTGAVIPFDGGSGVLG